MTKDGARGREADNEQRPLDERSPSEKLRGSTPAGSQIPGVQNPESTEIKKEVNPNTE